MKRSLLYSLVIHIYLYRQAGRPGFKAGWGLCACSVYTGASFPVAAPGAVLHTAFGFALQKENLSILLWM